MRVEFLGVGEACDEALPNTSLLVQRSADSFQTLLLDCGFTVASQFLQKVPDPDQLDALWISHFHGDHTFGLPQLLLRFFEMGRTKPLTFIGQPGIDDWVINLMELSYPGLTPRFGFDLQWEVLTPDRTLDLGGVSLQAAPTDHSQPNLALRVESGGRSLFYSGDGGMTSSSRELAKHCSLAVHEAYSFEPRSGGHSSVLECLDLAARACVQALALVHIRRLERGKVKSLDALELEARAGCPILVPEPGHGFCLDSYEQHS